MLELTGIDKVFQPGTVDEAAIFENFNFKVEAGQFVSVIGSNGSGKTTMLNLICGSLQPEHGSIRFQGKELTKQTEYKRARQIGRVFQDPKMGTCGELTILENMALADNKNHPFSLGIAVSKKRMEHYRTLLQTCEMGLENRMNVKVGSLSGGQRQALALIIAGMTDISLLILDEHTAALDPKAADTIMKLTEQIVSERKLTTLMVTHNLRFALEYGNRLVMMHEGRCILDLNETEKKAAKVEDLLNTFNQISIEAGN